MGLKWDDEVEALMLAEQARATRAQCQHERRGYQELNTLPAYSWCLDCGRVFLPLGGWS